MGIRHMLVVVAKPKVTGNKSQVVLVTVACYKEQANSSSDYHWSNLNVK